MGRLVGLLAREGATGLEVVLLLFGRKLTFGLGFFGLVESVHRHGLNSQQGNSIWVRYFPVRFCVILVTCQAIVCNIVFFRLQS